MNLTKFVPNAVSRQIGRQILLTQKNSPTILFATGVVGVVATVVMASRATLNLEDALAEAQENKKTAVALRKLHPEAYSEEEYKKDAATLYARNVLVIVKLYGPSVAMGVASIAALAGAHNILSKRNVALTAAYAAVEKGFAQYRARVVDELGLDKDREFRYGTETMEVITEEANGPKKRKATVVSSGAGHSIYARLFEEFNQNWEPTPEHNLMFLRMQQNWANDKLISRGHLFLNEVYDMLGMERSKEGQVTGWLWRKDDPECLVDFGIWDDSKMDRFLDFMSGRENAILVDFNVDGTIWDKI